MDAPERVVWSEGMLMTPQHMQQLDLYHERLLEFRLGGVSPYHYGVIDLELDRNALTSGQLQIQSYRGVLPSGAVLSFASGQGAGPPARPFDQIFPPLQKTLSVYLGIFPEREGTANVSKPDGELARATLATRQVADLVSGRSAQVAVGFGRLNSQILFDKEASNDFDCLKIAEIVRTDAGGFEVSDNYVPPLLQIGASPFIMSNLRRLLGLMVARQRSLSELTSERSASTLEFRSSDITTFLQMASVNSLLPVIQYFAETPQASPVQAYLALSQLAGQLMTFGARLDPTTLPRFVFTDLAATFRGLFDLISQFLNTTVLKRFVRLDCKLYKNGVLVAEIEDEALLKCKVWVLTARPTNENVSRDRMAVDMPKLSKIGAKSTIKGIIQAASNGVPLVISHRPPQEVPVREGVVYFTLNTADMTWKASLNERNIAIFIPEPFNPPDVEYELLAIPEQT